MARIFTTPAAEAAAKTIMHEITLFGGKRTTDQLTGKRDSYASRDVSAMMAICDEIEKREFKDVDSSLNTLRYVIFPRTLDCQQGYKRFKSEDLAKAIVYFAELINIYWDDTIRAPYEIDEFKKTILGNAVYKYGRYISAIKDPKAPKTKSSSTSSSTTTAGGATGSAPQNGYKSSGPQSGNVRDLQGNPGDKVTADTSYIYKIIGDKTGKNTPNVFIKPLSGSGEVNGTNKIFISSGNGYTDCTCYFDDPNDAQDFLDKINQDIQNGKITTNVQNLRVVKMGADPNGYFLVGTEYGTVAVSAKTLNEALTEAAKEGVKEEPTGWAKVMESCTDEEFAELHRWMRKD